MNITFLILRTFAVLLATFLSSAFADYPAVVIADNPMLYYRFEDSDGADALQDSSGNDLHSEDYLDVLLEQEGAIGLAAGFEGLGSVLTGLVLDPSEGDFSIELLVKPTVIAGTQVLVSNQDGDLGPGRSNLIVGPDGNVNSFVGGATTPSEAFIEADAWHHVVMTYDAEGTDTLRFFVDGEPTGTGTLFAESANGNWVIGAHKSQASQFTNALLDEVSIYNYRLDDPDGDNDPADSRITAHYQEYIRDTQVIVTFSSDKEFLSAGESATLSWSVGSVDVLTLDSGIGDVLPITVDGSGSIEVQPTATTTYTLSGEGPIGDGTAQVTIAVNSPPIIDSFTTSATEVISGQSVTLTWSTTNADSVTIEPGIGAVETSGSKEILIEDTVAYTLTATNAMSAVTSVVNISAKDGDPNLVAHWRIGEAVGETAGAVLISEVASSQNATFVEMPTWVVSGLAPIATQAAVEFDGINFADTESYSGVTGSHDRTISFWMKGGDIQNANATLVSWGSTANTTRWGIRVGGSGNIRTEVAGSGSEGTAYLLDDEWHHVAVVFADDGTPNIEDIVFYVDGELDDLSVVGNTAVNTSGENTVRIGASRTLANRGFTGLMDDVRIYDLALDQDGVKEVMLDAGGQRIPFAISVISYGSGAVTLTWPSTAAQTFGIDSSENLENWTEVDDGVPAGNGESTTYDIVDVESGQSYFRVRRE
ncbi:MAG: LamG domain-containing protein [Verrucomicrobiales bacterium]